MNDIDSANPRARLYAGAAATAYALWGAIHVWVGSTVIAKTVGDAPQEALTLLADARPGVSPPHFAPAATALTQQHGWNLLWIGGTVATLAWPILRHNRAAALWAFAIAGLADVGYLAAFVAPGFVRPSTWFGGPTLWLAGGLFSWFAARRGSSHLAPARA